MFCFRQANPHNYDAWFDYLRLVENDADADTVREVYERAIANMPPIQEKRHWKRYIYLWINYALYEELEVKVRSSRPIHVFLWFSLVLTQPNATDMNDFLHQDCERTRQVYQACLDLIPHKKVIYTSSLQVFI